MSQAARLGAPWDVHHEEPPDEAGQLRQCSEVPGKADLGCNRQELTRRRHRVVDPGQDETDHLLEGGGLHRLALQELEGRLLESLLAELGQSHRQRLAPI
eukprot:2004052-Heterocapsa_arctica.AAC.1